MMRGLIRETAAASIEGRVRGPYPLASRITGASMPYQRDASLAYHGVSRQNPPLLSPLFSPCIPSLIPLSTPPIVPPAPLQTDGNGAKLRTFEPGAAAPNPAGCDPTRGFLMSEHYSRPCIACGQTKLVSEFQSNGEPSHNGISKWKPRCHECHEQWKLAERPSAVPITAKRYIRQYGEVSKKVKLCPTCDADFEVESPPLWHCPGCAHHWDDLKIKTWGECPNCHQATPATSDFFV